MADIFAKSIFQYSIRDALNIATFLSIWALSIFQYSIRDARETMPEAVFVPVDHAFNTLLEMPVCIDAQPHPVDAIMTFNTLLEMPSTRTTSTSQLDRSTFNTLLEMLRAIGASAKGSRDILSILY